MIDSEKSKAKLYFTLIIIFWAVLILGASNYVSSNGYNNNYRSQDNAKVIDYYHLGLNSKNNILIKNNDSNSTANKKCQFIFPKEKTIIIRLDDVQQYAWNNIVMNITNDILKRDMAITLGVIPHGIGNDKIITNYLRNKIKDSRIEIAQHGTNHIDYEFKYLNRSKTYDLALSGLEEIVESLGIRPITFIPPNNEYNGNTTEVLAELGFAILSTKDEYKFDGNMVHIGLTIQTKYLDSEKLVPIEDILSSCNVSLEQKNICVISIHPQDYVDRKDNFDKNKYNRFIKLLNELKKLKKLGIRFATFKDLIRC